MQPSITSLEKNDKSVFGESSFLDEGLYEAESSTIFFDTASYSSPEDPVIEETKLDESPLYYKIVPMEVTGSYLRPLGA